MTRPVYEPTPARYDAYNDFGNQQLYRRPAPTSSFTPIAFRAATNDPQTLPTASEEEVHFPYWENEDLTVFDEDLSAGILQRVNFKQIGWYTTTVVQDWDAAFAADIGVLILHADNTTANWPLGLTPNEGAFHSRTAADQFFYSPLVSTTRKFPFLGTTSGDVIGGVYGSVLIKAYQNSGVNRTLNGCTLDIVFWGNSLNGLEPLGS